MVRRSNARLGAILGGRMFRAGLQLSLSDTLARPAEPADRPAQANPASPALVFETDAANAEPSPKSAVTNPGLLSLVEILASLKQVMPEVAIVVERWQLLSNTIRSAVLALVRTTDGN